MHFLFVFVFVLFFDSGWSLLQGLKMVDGVKFDLFCVLKKNCFICSWMVMLLFEGFFLQYYEVMALNLISC